MSNFATQRVARLLAFCLTINDRPLSKLHGPWPKGVVGQWNSKKSLNLLWVKLIKSWSHNILSYVNRHYKTFKIIVCLTQYAIKIDSIILSCVTLEILTVKCLAWPLGKWYQVYSWEPGTGERPYTMDPVLEDFFMQKIEIFYNSYRQKPTFLTKKIRPKDWHISGFWRH